MEIEKYVRPSILKLKGYSSARDEYSGEKAILLDANENPFPSEVNRYPDPYQKAVKKKLSKLKGIDENKIFLGNGSDEAIDLLFRIFCEPANDNIVTIDPTYGMYEVSAGINDVGVIKVGLTPNFKLVPEAVLQAVNSHTKMIFLCSPNNPSGNLLDAGSVIEIVSEFDGIVVIDEAYIDFAKSISFTTQIDDFDNIVVLQTFSKAWGLAGIRMGMAFANEAIIKLMNKVKPPYNINELTQQFALKLLDQTDIVDDKVEMIINERGKLKKALEKLDIVEKVFPSDSNFLLVKFSDAKQVYQQLCDEKIIVRDRSSVRYGENCLRITVGTGKENKKLIEALKRI